MHAGKHPEIAPGPPIPGAHSPGVFKRFKLAHPPLPAASARSPLRSFPAPSPYYQREHVHGFLERLLSGSSRTAYFGLQIYPEIVGVYFGVRGCAISLREGRGNCGGIHRWECEHPTASVGRRPRRIRCAWVPLGVSRRRIGVFCPQPSRMQLL
jgi:hypothetical protein